ncbi:hypothetical protein [Candidatus Spyradosoma sp. SGI.093]|uniref:hypothetical protein n=1 Tax=Candidatus Spyradosoma sp. SGI.093 TaxID=3420583 RepID=UPI003D04A781
MEVKESFKGEATFQSLPRNPSRRNFLQRRKGAKARRKTAKSKKVKESFKGEKRHGSTLRLLAALLKSFPQKFFPADFRRRELSFPDHGSSRKSPRKSAETAGARNRRAFP